MIGRVLGHYRILDRLGAGGMGVVYKAQDLHLGRPVALKILPPEKLADLQRKQRFAREAKAASALNHPNIITIYDVTSDDGVDFIAMEYVQGKTLDEMIPRNGMRLNEALKIAVQVADALAAAHAIGIVHRDIKPSNVMVGEQGRVKVLDFGVAKLKAPAEPAAPLASGTAAIHTDEGRIVGTVYYMSPEQAQGATVDERSDIFSFGSLLYEMISGRRAFQGDSTVATLAAIIEKEPPSLSGKLPANLEKVLARCLRKDPSRRYQHMDDVRMELQDLVEESASKPGAAAATRRMRRVAWLLAAAVLIGMVGAVASFLVFRGEPALPPPRLVALTSYAGVEEMPALSADGTQVAFSWNGEKQDNVDIYVQFVGDTFAHRLTSDPRPDLLPCWSPDGRRLAFLRQDAGKGTLLLVGSQGGPEQRLEERPAMRGGISWSPDGRFLAVGIGAVARLPGRPETAGGIYLIPVAGGEPRQITFPQAPMSDLFPQFSHQGTSIAFVRYQTGRAASDVYVQQLTPDYLPAGSTRRITTDGKLRFGLDWTQDDKGIVYDAWSRAAQSLYRVSMEGGQPERIELAGLFASWPTISKNRLAFTRELTDVDIWRFQVGGAPEPFIRSSGHADWGPQFSPDGEKVAFTSDRNGNNNEIWVADADGSNPRQLTHQPGLNQGTPRWSPDGLLLAFDSQGRDGAIHIYTMESAGGQVHPLTSGGSSEFQPSWSRDGKWIYFTSDRSGRLEIWRCPFPSGTREQWQQMTTAGGDVAFESSDGRMLYYTKVDGQLYAKPVAGGSDQKLIDKVTRGFAALEKGIFYCGAIGQDGKVPVLFYEFSSRSNRELTRITPLGAWGASFSVAPDGKTILFSASLYSGKDLMLIENFR